MLSEREIKYLLMRTDNGAEDIISKRSKVMQETSINLDELSISELITFIQRHPSVLKRPIVMNQKSFLIGYDEEEIDAFLPPQMRGMNQSIDETNSDNFNIGGKRLE